MKRLKSLFLGIVIGIPLGLWFGYNLGQDRPVYANPFNKKQIQKKFEETGKEVIRSSGEVMEKGGKLLQEKIDQQSPEKDTH